MSWITPSITDIYKTLSAGELAAVNSAALTDGQASPVTEVIAGVVAELRGRLRNRTPLETGATIPAAWVPHAVAVVRFRLCSRLPVKLMSTPQRETEYRDALDAFAQLGPILPEVPVTVDTAQPGGSAPKMNARTSYMTREYQDGL